MNLENHGRMVNIISEPGKEVHAFMPWALGNLNESIVLSSPAESSDRAIVRTRRSSGGLCHRYSDFESNHINENSICPWTLSEDRDNNRIPVSIVKATCKCYGRCFHEKQLATCQPFTHPIPVKKKINGQWTDDVEQVTVGCVCSFR